MSASDHFGTSAAARESSAGGLRGADFRVCAEHRPGWVRASERTPGMGETVYCAGGEGTVVGLHGRTGNGSRLLQIRLTDAKAPFFAAASNVLVRPD